MRIHALFFFLIIITSRLSAQQITYYRDIEPIILNSCAPCHKPGKAAPFSLLSYDDVAKRASFIKDVVQSKYMPPWRADNQYVHFVNDRSLSQKEIDIISKWADNKAPAGNKQKTSLAESAALANTSYPRKPDLVLKMKDSFLVKGDGVERFVVFKIPFELKDTANIEAIEFFSNNEKLVHHANYETHEVADSSIDIYHTDSYVNLTEDDRSRFAQYLPYRKTITYYGGWIPGSAYESFPKDIGWVMPKRGVILLTVHYAPQAKDMQSICGINLFYKNTPVKRKVKVISFGSGGIGEKEITPSLFIPANAVKTFTLDVTNPGEDFSVMDIWPHMHYIGKEFTAYFTTQAGDTVRLVHIPDWDFRWQEIYRFQHLIKIPKGSTLHIIGTYDNTANNPMNPSNPPQAVWSFGDMRSTDEMMTLMMVFLPYENGDENIGLQK